MSTWKKFTGSEEQLSEIKESKHGWIVKWKDGTLSSIFDDDGENHDFHLVNFYEVAEYMICQPHPHSEMIIEWARTGREVYWYNGCGQWVIDDNPVWWPDMKYSFNPDG
ncbi:hypothetical protein [Nitrosomonas sp. Nm34]|uniref:hypothetical protein n=1 Tax=Nitrosomonas sp. Nm34 TaxID=1881055 RepID=UPI0008EE146A|nr:hypothetical protein [Nitrosomonas sp. Nm34]SFI31658.1 hypothetical protein SAMN05428978_100585 [Nitrosomonas sp. Nm34]